MRDTKEILTCPACGNEMKKIFIEEANLNIDICLDGCGGIFFDNRELERFDEKNDNIDKILVLLEEKKFEKTDETQNRLCPNCSSVMVKNYTDISQEVQIDCCYSCGGKFLDNQELQKLRKQFDTEEERSNDFHEKFLQKYSQEIYPEYIEAEINPRKPSFPRKIFLNCFEKIRNMNL